ncbi:MAG: phosphoribosylformylglycinamidine synthase subunit PurQ, partial [Spirochaetaceae bacterium]|nr:phosphoribosylformylglycinamidine synthase subunit PurQ [Spirochaetaceae bacterium]
MAVAVGELSDGLDINLDAVQVKYQGMNGLELALSESQERMAVVVHPDDTQTFINLAAEENLEAVVVAEVTSERRLKMNWKEEAVINLSRNLLDTNGVRRTARAHIAAGSGTVDTFNKLTLTPESLKTVLSSIELASRGGLEERFDGSVGGTTVLASHAGIRQLTPAEASVHLLPAKGDVETAGVMSVGFDPSLASVSPFRGGQYALIEALAKLTAAGGSWRKARFSLQEFFGRTDRGPRAWGDPLAALLGALTVQREWGLPAIGGKDSMSGSFEELSVPPTIIAFAAAGMDAHRAVSAALPGKDLTLVLVCGNDSASGLIAGSPDFDNLAAGWDWIESLGVRGHLKSCSSVGKGGWAAKLVLMCLGNNIGVELDSTANPFSADYGALIAALDLSPEELQDDAGKMSADIRILGRSTADPVISWSGGTISLGEAEESWRAPFAEVWPEERSSEEELELAPGTSLNGKAVLASIPLSRVSRGKPRVCIPVFPGTNGEDDALRAFSRAGGEGAEHIFLDRDSENLNAALSGFAGSIDKSQILYISGGFSAGDEPDGAGKYIAAILRQERVADAIHRLLERDGLILGICNGFQALIKSGWLIDGKPGVPGVNDPGLTHNRIGRHVARMVQTVAPGAQSPWLSRINRGDVHTMPVSHGEGRFTAPLPVLEKLAASGRIAFQYCDA